MRVTDFWIQLDRCEKALGVLRVVGQDIGAELDFATRFVDALAHLQRRQLREVVELRVHQLGGFRHDDRPLRVRLMPPRFITALRRRDLLFQLFVGEFNKRFERLPVERIHAFVFRSRLEGLHGHCC